MTLSPVRETPRARITAACRRLGHDVVVQACIDLIHEREADPALITVLGGPHATTIVSIDVHRYWLRVWATRGLMWAWNDAALPSLRQAMRDDAWRVREMAAKAVARNVIDAALDDVLTLRDDPVLRVRTAAERAVMRLTGR